jgi:hypothetical protein
VGNRIFPEKITLLLYAGRETSSHLFSGADGLSRNPHGQKNVAIDQTEAVEMIILANCLFKIVVIRHGALVVRTMGITQ